MNIMNIKNIIGTLVLLSVAVLALAPITSVQADDNDVREPDLPAVCSSIQVEAGNKVSFRAYALGVQIYRWNGAAWVFVAPEANLYADANYRGKIGTHYGGPTWESNSGSNVVAARVQNTGCTPDATAIPWLLLKKVST